MFFYTEKTISAQLFFQYTDTVKPLFKLGFEDTKNLLYSILLQVSTSH